MPLLLVLIFAVSSTFFPAKKLISSSERYFLKLQKAQVCLKIAISSCRARNFQIVSLAHHKISLLPGDSPIGRVVQKP